MKKIVCFSLSVVMAATMATTALAADLTTVTDKTAEELSVFMHKETRHMAEDVIRICAKEGVSAEFIAAIMRYERRPDLHNYFGWTGSDGKLIRYENDVQCLETVIPIIKKNYLDPEGKYYNGATVEGVSVYYNNSDFWRDTMNREIDRMFQEER